MTIYSHMDDVIPHLVRAIALWDGGFDDEAIGSVQAALRLLLEVFPAVRLGR